IPNNRTKKITVKGIQKLIADKYNVIVDEILSKKRTKSIAFTRQISMNISRELSDLSLPKIVEEFGGGDHTSFIHGHKKVSEEMANDTVIENENNTYQEEIKKNIKL